MLLKQTKVSPCDRCGILVVKTFHIYAGTAPFRGVGSFTLGSVRVVSAASKVSRKAKVRNALVRSNIFKPNSLLYSLKSLSLSVLAFKRRLTPLGSQTNGFISRFCGFKKIQRSFIGKL